jgi:hypothetical protein
MVLLLLMLSNGFDKNLSEYIHAPSKWSGFICKDEKEEDAEHDKDDDRIDAFQKYISETDFSSTKIILIDDADSFSSQLSQYTNAIKFEHLQVPTISARYSGRGMYDVRLEDAHEKPNCIR